MQLLLNTKNPNLYKISFGFFWCSRRESNPKLRLRRTLLSPFNYGNIFDFLDTSQSRKIEKYPFGCKKDVNSFAVSRFVSELTPKMRLYMPFCPQSLGQSNSLGGPYYIHLTTEAYVKLSKNSNGYNRVPFCRAIGDCERRRLSRHIHLTTEAYIKLFSVKQSLRAWCVKSLTERFPLTIFYFTTIRVSCQSQQPSYFIRIFFIGILFRPFVNNQIVA